MDMKIIQDRYKITMVSGKEHSVIYPKPRNSQYLKIESLYTQVDKHPTIRFKSGLYLVCSNIESIEFLEEVDLEVLS